MDQDAKYILNGDISMNHFEDLVCAISLKAKECGYRKNRLTWYKVKDNLTVVFSIQKSQFDSSIWYYNYGICLHDIAEGNTHKLNSCQIKYRLDHVIDGVVFYSDRVIYLLEQWDSMYGDVKLLKACAVQGKLPVQSTLKAIRYLTTIDVTKL